MLQETLTAHTLNLMETVSRTANLTEAVHLSLETICHNDIGVNISGHLEFLGHTQTVIESLMGVPQVKLQRLARQFESLSWDLLRVAELEMETNGSEVLAIHQRYTQVYNSTQVWPTLHLISSDN